MSSLIPSLFGSLQLLSRGAAHDDDFVDRLHYELTSSALVALAVLVSFKQFGGRPVECMVPDTFTGAWEEYSEMYCFAKNTYFLPLKFIVPQSEDTKRDREISYYQWVPFFLLFQAVCFQFPFLAWRVLATHSGLKLHDVVAMARRPENLKMESAGESLTTVRIHLENALRFHRRLQEKKYKPHSSFFFCLNLPYTSIYVACLFLLIKLFYLANVCGQFFMLNSFLNTKTDNEILGIGAVRDLFAGRVWEDSGYFPRVTLCDVPVRKMGNIQTYTMQCVLVINILNEKIFVFLWFWFQFLAFLTILSTCYWTIMLTIPSISVRFVKRHLELADMPVSFGGARSRQVLRFVNTYLQRDGIFVLRMVEMHAGAIFAADLTSGLWTSFTRIEDIRWKRKSQRRKNVTLHIETDETDEEAARVPMTAPVVFSTDVGENKAISQFFFRRKASLPPNSIPMGVPMPV